MKDAELKLNEMVDVFVRNFRGSQGYNDLIKKLKRMPEPKTDEYTALVVEIHGVQNVSKQVAHQLAAATMPFTGHA